MSAPALSEVGRITRMLVRHARDAFVDDAAIAGQWRGLNFTAPPDFSRALGEYERFLDIVGSRGARIDVMQRDPGAPDPDASGRASPKPVADLRARQAKAGLDSIYVRDASVVCSRGVILGNMGKPQRAGEPAAQEAALRALHWPIAGAILDPGRLEGGDVVWLDDRTIAVARGYRTNDEGIRQLRDLLAGTIDELIVVPLPHWRGPGDVFHLMSMLSPVDRDLAVVYSPLMPVPLRERLLDRGMTFVDVPDEEFETMGTNVLAIAPRTCVMVAGNPRTRAALGRAGAEVFEYEGFEISRKGGGGPTCLTRPLERTTTT